MAREFLVRLTLENGQVIGGVFTPLADDDLPRVLPNPAGGYHAPYLVVDQYGRILSAAADPTVAFTNAANTFTAGPQTIQPPTLTRNLVLEGDATADYIRFHRTGLTSRVGPNNDLNNFRSLYVGFDPGDAPNANIVAVGGSNAQFWMYDSAGTGLQALFGVATGVGGLTTSTAIGDLVFRCDSGAVHFASGTATRLYVSTAGETRVLFSDAATTTASDVLVLRHASSGTPAAGFGSNLRFQLQSSTTADREAAALAAAWLTATDATRAAKLTATVYYTTTAREAWRAEASSTGLTLYLAGSNASVADDGTASFAAGGFVVGLAGALLCGSIAQTSGVWTLADDGSAAFASGAASVLTDGSLRLASIADASAVNDSWFLSATSGKASYKDSGGTVHALY